MAIRYINYWSNYRPIYLYMPNLVAIANGVHALLLARVLVVC